MSIKSWKIPILGVTLIELIIMAGVVFFVRTYVFQLFRVHGPSMCPTLNQEETCLNSAGDLVFVNEFLYAFQEDPKAGEVVVFKSPHQNIYVIKRVIGVPGDEIQIKDKRIYKKDPESGTMLELDEPYLSEKNRNNTRTFGRTKFVVPEGEYFLLGDNRARSQDGRQCYSASPCGPDDKTTVPKDLIRGRAEAVLYPFDKFGSVEAYYRLLES